MGRALPDSDDDTYPSSNSTQNGSEDDVAYETDATVDPDINSDTDSDIDPDTDSDVDPDVDDEENRYGTQEKDSA